MQPHSPSSRPIPPLSCSLALLPFGSPSTLPSPSPLSLSLALPLSGSHGAQGIRRPPGAYRGRHVARGKFQTFDRPSVEAEPENAAEGEPEGSADGGRADE